MKIESVKEQGKVIGFELIPETDEEFEACQYIWGEGEMDNAFVPVMHSEKGGVVLRSAPIVKALREAIEAIDAEGFDTSELKGALPFFGV